MSAALSFEITGPLAEKLRSRAQHAGVSEVELVTSVLDAVIPSTDTPEPIIAFDCSEDQGAIVLDRDPDESEQEYLARTELYSAIFGR